jgi:Arc/MetJ-type ribon-helix-helix transcriptional regulator
LSGVDSSRRRRDTGTGNAIVFAPAGHLNVHCLYFPRLLGDNGNENARMTIQITRPELEALINQRLQSGEYKDAEDVVLQALRASDPPTAELEHQRRDAIERLRIFGKTHGLSLDGITLRELREHARP